MRDSIMEDQDELIEVIRKSECEELGLEANTNTKAVLEDVGHNADLYIANQEVKRTTHNTHTKLGAWPVQSFELCATSKSKYEVVGYLIT